MLRGLADAILLFLVPFVLYGLLVVLNRRFALFVPGPARGRFIMLAAIGLALVIAGFVVYGAVAPRGAGAYVPAHVQDGQIVPGHFR